MQPPTGVSNAYDMTLANAATQEQFRAAQDLKASQEAHVKLLERQQRELWSQSLQTQQLLQELERAKESAVLTAAGCVGIKEKHDYMVQCLVEHNLIIRIIKNIQTGLPIYA